MVSPHEVARDTAEAGLTRLVRALAVIMPSLALLQAPDFGIECRALFVVAFAIRPHLAGHPRE